MRPPFERIDPRGPETPVVVEIPHAGLESAPPFLEPLAAPARSLARDADLYVDSLYSEAPDAGATVLVSRTSRYVIDVNRGEGDVDAEVVEGARADVRLHHGLVWRTTSDGEPALSRRRLQIPKVGRVHGGGGGRRGRKRRRGEQDLRRRGEKAAGQQAGSKTGPAHRYSLSLTRNLS